jgi:hypothetical protein
MTPAGTILVLGGTGKEAAALGLFNDKERSVA